MVLKQSEEYERYVIKLNLILPGTPILLPKKIQFSLIPSRNCVYI